MGIPKPILDLAARQGGYVTREQLLSHGLSPSAVDRRVAEGVIASVKPGIYLVIPASDYIDLLRGAVLALPDAVVSHQSAAHLLRFPKLPRLVPTVVVASHTTHRFPGVTVRRCDDLISSDIIQVEGLPVTNVTRTFFALGRLLKFGEWDSIGESLVIAGRMGIPQFERMTQRLARRGKPGSVAAHTFLEIRTSGDARDTILERKGRQVLVDGGLPLPTPQYQLPWGRVDDAFVSARLSIEWDSREHHVQMAQMEKDRRRDRQAAIHDWINLRFTWDDVVNRPDEIVDTVRKLLKERQHRVAEV